jgi:hypothetical protein
MNDKTTSTTEEPVCCKCRDTECAPDTGEETWWCDSCAYKAGMSYCQSCELYTPNWGSNDETCEDCLISKADFYERDDD